MKTKMSVVRDFCGCLMVFGPVFVLCGIAACCDWVISLFTRRCAKFILALLLVGLVSSVSAARQEHGECMQSGRWLECYDDDGSYIGAVKTVEGFAAFARWMQTVYYVAPRYGLTLHPKDGRQREAEEEFFYLYCWQSEDHSVVHAIEKAKKSWSGSSATLKTE